MLGASCRHRREVITRRTVFELRKARERGHILEGLAVALSNVDEIIAMIKAAQTPPKPRRGLMSRTWRFTLVARHACPRRDGGVLAPRCRPDGPSSAVRRNGYRCPMRRPSKSSQLRLQRLTGLEQDKIVAEYKEVMDEIDDLLDILARPARVSTIIGDELTAVKNEFGQTKAGARRSVVEHSHDLTPKT